MTALQAKRIAMLSIHSSPIGPLGSLNTGGMSVYVSELTRWLGRNGFQIDIFTYMPAASRVVELHPNVRLIHLLPDRQPAPAKERLPDMLADVFAALAQYCRAHDARYDLIHSHYWISAMVGAMARDTWHVPHLATFHTLGAVKNDTTADENEPRGRIASEKRLVHLVDGIIVPVDAEKVHLVNYYQAPPHKVSTIAGGVNLERFKPQSRAAARRKLGLSDADEVALFVGRFAPLKGLGALLQALALLKSRRPRLKVVLAGGDGPAAARDKACLDQARTLGIDGRLVFAGRIDPKQLIDYYAAADFLALPSHYESFGLVVMEALACGTPVLATPVGIAPSVIREGVNGTIVPRPDAASVAQGMLRLLSRPRDRRPSPTRVRETVAGYGWQQTAARVAGCYADALAAFGKSEG